MCICGTYLWIRVFWKPMIIYSEFLFWLLGSQYCFYWVGDRNTFTQINLLPNSMAIHIVWYKNIKKWLNFETWQTEPKILKTSSQMWIKIEKCKNAIWVKWLRGNYSADSGSKTNTKVNQGQPAQLPYKLTQVFCLLSDVDLYILC